MTSKAAEQKFSQGSFNDMPETGKTLRTIQSILVILPLMRVAHRGYSITSNSLPELLLTGWPQTTAAAARPPTESDHDNHSKHCVKKGHLPHPDLGTT